MTDKTHTSCAAALAAAQSEFTAVVKNAKNPHFKKTYADLSSVLSACLPALTANGIAVVQPIGTTDGSHWVKTILVHGESNTMLECTVPLLLGGNDMQKFGGAVTYARRYGLMAMTALAPEDDDGNLAATAPQQSRQPKPPEFAPAKFRDFFKDGLKKCKTPAAIENAKTAYSADLDKLAEASPPMFAEVQKAITDRIAEVTPKDDAAGYEYGDGEAA